MLEDLVVLLQRRAFDEQRAGDVNHAFEGHDTPVFNPLPVYPPLEERDALHVQIPLFWGPAFGRGALLVALRLHLVDHLVEDLLMAAAAYDGIVERSLLGLELEKLAGDALKVIGVMQTARTLDVSSSESFLSFLEEIVEC